jgi:hypothetical protein
MKNQVEDWEHYMIFRVNKLNTKDTNREYKYKEYLILPIIEITVCILCMLVLTAGVLSILLRNL